jgi:hypothetical protein
VYPARGSHASYFAPGIHWTGAWFDNADGERPAPALNLQIISDTAPGDRWAAWPGMWGGTQPPSGDINPLDDSSPRGPGRHTQYRQPDALLQSAIAHKESLAPRPPARAVAPPTVHAVARGNDVHIEFDSHVTDPAGLVVTFGDPSHSAPPPIRRIQIDARSGTVVIPNAPQGQQVLHVSIGTSDGSASPATEAKLG